MDEQWKPIPGYEGHYAVSDKGRIRRIAPHPCGRVIDGRLLKLTGDDRGYYKCLLSKNGRVENYKVHTLVAMAFIGPKPIGHEINHKDGNPSNNDPANLEYVTHQQNIIHKYHVLGNQMISGEAHHMAKASSKQVEEAKRLIAPGADKQAVAAMFGHHFSWAYRLAHGQTRVNG